MAEIARAEWNVPLRWTETASRDTHENAVNTVALLRPAGIREIVLVTHGLHMPRALREFRAAAAAPAASAPDAHHPGADGPGDRPSSRRCSTGCRRAKARCACTRCCTRCWPASATRR